jgi:predicted TIM-barrel fold metal-dependent hydrolase
MRNGFKVFDTDTHLESSAETMERYFDAAMRKRQPELERLKEPMRVSSSGTVPASGKHQYRLPGRVSYQRILGQAGPAASAVRNLGRFNGTVTPAQGAADDQPAARIRDMDREGVDVHLMLPGIPSNVFATHDLGLELGLIRAQHRLLDDFCGRYPRRLKSLIIVSADAIGPCVDEIRRWGAAPWAVGVWPVTMDTPIDHPDFEPVWRACADYDLCVVYHGYTWNPPYFPGHREI